MKKTSFFIYCALLLGILIGYLGGGLQIAYTKAKVEKEIQTMIEQKIGEATAKHKTHKERRL